MGTGARRPSRQAGQEIKRLVDLIRRQAASGGRQRGGADSAQVTRNREHGNAGKIATLFVVAEKEESFVFYDWATDRAAKLIADVRCFVGNRSRDAADGLRDEAAGIARAPFVVAIEKETLAMKFVGAGFRDGVDNTARGASVFGRVIRSVDLVLTNRRLANYITDARAALLFREEGLIVVAAVDGAVVQQS